MRPLPYSVHSLNHQSLTRSLAHPLALTPAHPPTRSLTPLTRWFPRRRWHSTCRAKKRAPGYLCNGYTYKKGLIYERGVNIYERGLIYVLGHEEARPGLLYLRSGYICERGVNICPKYKNARTRSVIHLTLCALERHKHIRRHLNLVLTQSPRCSKFRRPRKQNRRLPNRRMTLAGPF